MRCLTIVALLLSVACIAGCGPSATAEPTEIRIPPSATPEAPTLTPTFGPGPSVTAEPTQTRIPPTATEAPTLTPTPVNTMTPIPVSSPEPTPDGPQLIMVHIRAISSREVKQLRDMHLDIAAVRPDPERPPAGELDLGGFIVEAVVTRGELATLKAKGFEITEIPSEP